MISTESLNLKNTPLEMDIPNNEDMTPDEFTLSRRNGLGASEASIILGVNPYTTRTELLENKLTAGVTAEEKAIAKNPAVIKGNKFEPIILEKVQALTGWKIIKPPDQYRLKDTKFMKINFDGVIDQPDKFKTYIPCEIKYVTMRGERHYSPAKAHMSDLAGIINPQQHPDDFNINLSYGTQAQLLGIPVYYYTQLQVQMLGLNAPFGYLATYNERDGRIYIYFVLRNDRLISELIAGAYKFWDIVEHKKTFGDQYIYVDTNNQV